MKKPLVILTGPTAAGKTKLSINLAKAINGEIVSADSMQVYRRMDIGSAKIRPAEMQGVPHHLIDVLDPKEDFNVVLFQKMCIRDSQQRHPDQKTPRRNIQRRLRSHDGGYTIRVQPPQMEQSPLRRL